MTVTRLAIPHDPMSLDKFIEQTAAIAL